MKKMIFHCPFVLNKKAKSASGIRPIKMLEAFESLGFQVDVISGDSVERKKLINNLLKKIDNGEKYEFLYSESSTMPTALTDYHHLPLSPFLDFNFFKNIKSKNIPIGLFYRDIHWLFDHYGIGMPWYKKKLALFFYNFDLKNYNKYVDVLYLPSLGMGDFFKQKVSSVIFKELPPAHSIYVSDATFTKKEKLNLLYVGGVGENYNIKKIFNVVKNHKNISFVICTRELDWKRVKHEYGIIPENIKVVHKSGGEVKDLYKSADIGVLFVEPKNYWSFAVPFKFYEYIGENKPILSTKGTFVGNSVTKLDIGWALEYDEKILNEFFDKISINDLEEKFNNLLDVKSNETWQSRAKQVAENLCGLK